MEQGHLAQFLGDAHLALENIIAVGFYQILRPNTDVHLQAFLRTSRRGRRDGNPAGVEFNGGLLSRADDFAGKQVHGGRADELGDKLVLGPGIQFQRSADLTNVPTGGEQHDAARQGHGLHLVVGHVDHGALGHRLLELGNLNPGGHPQRRIKIGERLVEQINLGIAHDRAADSNPLTLAAGERLGQSVEIGLHLEDPRGLRDGGIDHLTRLLGELEGKAHVLAHVHVRIQAIGLEHHRDTTLGRWHIVDDLPFDLQCARRDGLEPGDHAQKGRLATARRPE